MHTCLQQVDLVLVDYSEIGSSPLNGCGANCWPGRKYWQPTVTFMIHVTCRLTAKNRDQLRNRKLGSRVWASFFDYSVLLKIIHGTIVSCCVCVCKLQAGRVIAPGAARRYAPADGSSTRGGSTYVRGRVRCPHSG